MKTSKNLFLLIVISTITIPLLAQSAQRVDSAQLKELQLQTEKWMHAYNSQDAQNLVPLYSEDAAYISAHVGGLVALGRDKVIANFQNGMRSGGHIDSIEILAVDVSCDLAALFCKYQATNSGVTVMGRNLLVVKKINGTWLIIRHMTVV